jgi:MFS family permease
VLAGAPPDRKAPVWQRSTSAIVIALGVGQIFGWGCSYYLLGALAWPIADETGWSETWILAGLSLSLMIAGAISPRMGRAVAKRGGRSLLAASTLLLATGLVILANSHAQITYLLGWMVMGLGMGLGLYDAAFATLGSHFGEASRGPITALTLIAGFSSTVTWPLSLFFLGQIGWRGTCIAYAVIEVALCLPLHLLFGPSIARSARTEPVGAALSDRSLPRDRTFYILGAILTLIAAVTAVVSVNLILILAGLGVAYATAVGLAALLGPSQVLARLGEMFLGRQFIRR